MTLPTTAAMLVHPRDLLDWSTAPPELRSRVANNPTLLFSWWCTLFSAVIIITRLCGRKIRSNVLFREDWIMMMAMVPLFARMAFVHVVLLYGTNNVQTEGHTFTQTQLDHHALGSKLVLAARIFYAMYIWMSKVTVSEFLKRITIRIWRKSYEVTLQGIRIFLAVTFVAVVIATLAECHPFPHYWQVIPDPGPQCRQGFAQLLTMGVCDIVTDVLLVAFPIPIIVQSGQNWKRKFQLALLFSLSVVLIAVTGTRMPQVIERHGRQQYRTVWASAEILASTAVANCVVLGAFLRDKGSKKNKYRAQSTTDSMDRVSNNRRPTLGTIQSMDSDEDLFRSLGCRVPEHLQDKREPAVRPAPAALPAPYSSFSQHSNAPVLAMHRMEPSETDSIDSESSLRKNGISLTPFSPASANPPPSVPSIFDIGGLLEDGKPSSLDSQSHSTTLVGPRTSSTVTQDFANSTPELSRHGSHTFISDLGGIQGSSRRILDGRAPPIGVLAPTLERHETQQSLQDAGGLLDDDSPTPQPWRPSLPTQSSSSNLSRHSGSQLNFHDVGGLLSNNHVPDISASPLSRITDSPLLNPFRSIPRSTPNPPHRQPTHPDEMELHDIGGLL
ncbi:Hypothetical protein R9X50_00185400 [Acrodontium crateriforme]|uniref:Rhodopsin domain-containing protein n=1 Tax=Acrodontium crateriforme TaxID=150365 RepID=A0AAQ3M028_9PEZI|nr:Hypothetical protein R9X50_00185400 [Acrodontium crateriforme]